MKPKRSLPVFMPQIPGQRWSCHSCGLCCRALVGHLFAAERERIDEQGWEDELGVAPYVKVGRGYALNKRADGRCVFLTGDNLCMIHARYGEDAKPLACCIFPFSARPIEKGWQISCRFDCPSVTGSSGDLLMSHKNDVQRLTGRMTHRPVRSSDVVLLDRKLVASPQEVDMLTSRVVRWMQSTNLSIAQRIVGIGRVATMLTDAKLAKVRGQRFRELLDLLFGALPAESRVPPGTATSKQRGMLRQLVFAHAEHVTLDVLQLRFTKRVLHSWHQLRVAERFRSGSGIVPPLPGIEGESSFEAVEAVPHVNNETDAKVIDDLLTRYILARLAGRSVFGDGYYSWPMFSGLAAISLALSATGWLARLIASTQSCGTIGADDVCQALGIVDRAATRLPAPGSVAERLRVGYLMQNDGLARLARAFLPTGDAPWTKTADE